MQRSEKYATSYGIDSLLDETFKQSSFIKVKSKRL